MPERKNCGHTRPAKGKCPQCHTERMRAARAADPTRHILVLMIQRCHNAKHPRYALYGGRGIAVCQDWRDREHGYARFIEHIGPRPSLKHSIDRIDNSRGYEPGNVRWATQSQQMSNTRRSRKFTIGGTEKTLKQLETESGVTNLGYRLEHGRSIEQALAEPVRPKERLITFGGRTLNLGQWSLDLGGKATLVTERLSRGWSEEEAVSTPAGRKRGWRKRRAA
jgi:hypothetical protein